MTATAHLLQAQAALNLALAVAVGAFGAHGLKARVGPEQLAWWHTGTEYFFYHALGMLLLGVLALHVGTRVVMPFWLLQGGIVLFCGSLFLMTLGAPRWLGAITPLGGLFFIAGWLVLAWRLFRMNTDA